MASPGSSVNSSTSPAVAGRFVRWIGDSLEFVIVLSAAALVLIAYSIAETWFVLSNMSGVLALPECHAGGSEAQIERTGALHASDVRKPQSPFQPLPPRT